MARRSPTLPPPSSAPEIANSDRISPVRSRAPLEVVPLGGNEGSGSDDNDEDEDFNDSEDNTPVTNVFNRHPNVESELGPLVGPNHDVI